LHSLPGRQATLSASFDASTLKIERLSALVASYESPPVPLPLEQCIHRRTALIAEPSFVARLQ